MPLHVRLSKAQENIEILILRKTSGAYQNQSGQQGKYFQFHRVIN
jgi:hypothetical protein